MEQLLPLLLIFAVMMLPLLWMSSRQRKVQQKQRELVNALGVGDEVRTHSGFYGLIVEAYDDVVVLESEDGSQTKWARQAIAMAVEEPVADDATAADDVDDAAEPAAGEQPGTAAASVEMPGVADDAERRDR